MLIGNTTSSYLGLTDVRNVTASVRLVIPNLTYGKLASSIRSFFLNGGTTEYVQFVFTPNPNATPGIYVIPIRIITEDPGVFTNGTVNLVYDIEKKDSSIVNYDMVEEMSNFGKNLAVSLNLYNPTGKVINNTVMSLKFPSFSGAVQDITFTGAQANETFSGGETSLQWLTPFIQPGHSVQLSYSVPNITDLPLLLAPPTSIASTAGVTAPTFTLLNVLPTNLTLGENAIVTVVGLYQGRPQHGMTLQLSPLVGTVKVTNPIQLISNVLQSQIISTAFAVAPNVVGNTTLRVALKGQNINQTYYVPISVSPKPTALTQSVKIVAASISLIFDAVLTVALLILALQVATEEMPKSIAIEKGTEATSHIALSKQKYDHVFELLSKRVAEKETKWC